MLSLLFCVILISVMKMKTVLITGASRGIGKACAIAFAKEGYGVALNYNVSERAAMEVKEEISALGAKCEIYKCNVSDSKAVCAMVNAIENEFGSIDVLVNNAGIAQQKLFDTLTDEDFDRMLGINTKGVFNCSREVSRIMLRNHKGSIVNISSMWGSVGASMEVHYSASKAAVNGMTKALSKELGPSGIRVNCIAPGLIDTEMNAIHSEETLKALTEEISLMRMGRPEEVAELAVFLAGDRASYITGQVIGVDGGI